MLLSIESPEVLPEHVRELIDCLLWKITEADGKWNTRYKTIGALECIDKKQLRHEHVYQKAKMIEVEHWFDKAEDNRKAIEPHEKAATKADIEELTEWLLDRFGSDKDDRKEVYAQEKPVTKADIEALSERLEESFAKDEGELETEKPATKADMTALVNRLLLQLANTADTQALAVRLKQLEQSNQTLLKLNSRVSWICLLLLVALIASLLQHC